VISVALWLVLLAAGLGASFALWNTWAEIQAQRYLNLKFTRTIFLMLEQAADSGVLAGSLTALWFLAGLLLACAWAPVRALLEPREMCAMLRSNERRLRAQVVVASVFAIALAVLSSTGEGLKRAELYLLCLMAVLGVVGLSVIARWLKRASPAHDPRIEAQAFAAVGALLVLCSLGFLVDRPRIWRPFAPAFRRKRLLSE
jgi:hypothetical protein